MTQPEQPWVPGPSDMPWPVVLLNPNGDRHLTLNDQEGRFYRLWQHRPPEPMHAGDAILLRPSDIDQIIQQAMIWLVNNPGHIRANALVDEIAQGAKAVVMHFAKLSGAR